MMFGPDWSLLFWPMVITLPVSFFLFVFGFRVGNALVGNRQSWSRVAAAVALQWVMVVALQFIFGHQLSLWLPEASESTWLVILTFAIPVAGILAAYLALRHKWKPAIIVGMISSCIGIPATIGFLYLALKVS